MSQTVMQIAAAVPAGDIFQTINGMSSKATGTAKVVGGAIAVILVVVLAWKAKLAIAGLLLAGVAGLVFMFIVNNISNADLQQTVKDTVIPANGFVPHHGLPPTNAIGSGDGPAALPSLPSAA